MNKYLNFEFLAGGICALMSVVADFVMPVWPFLLFLFFAVLVDLYFGTKAAKARKETIHSKGLRRTVGKLANYSIAILLLHGLTVVFLPSVNFAYFGAFAIALAEVKSIIENFEVISGVKIWAYIKDRLKVPGIDKKS